ncbi:MAG: signal peptidase II [Lentisphaeria bacterium]|nr:signal peptidase II [Lentisphaeria bacterium]
MNAWPRVKPGTAAERRLLWISGAAAFAVLAADQAVKFWFVRSFALHESREVIPGWLNFTYVRNFGAAWSIFSGHVWPLLIFGLLAAAGILIFFRKLAENCPERYVAQMLILSGIVGNSIDRMFRGAVVDFIHVHYESVWHYPVFNIADMAICCGIGVFVISGFIRKPSTSEAGDAERGH